MDLSKARTRLLEAIEAGNHVAVNALLKAASAGWSFPADSTVQFAPKSTFRGTKYRSTKSVKKDPDAELAVSSDEEDSGPASTLRAVTYKLYCAPPTLISNLEPLTDDQLVRLTQYAYK